MKMPRTLAGDWGRKIERMDSNVQPPRRQKVLILIRQEVPGRPYIEVYGGRTIDVHIRTVPFVGTNRGEILAEEFTRLALPRCYERLLDEKPRAHDVVSIQRPSEVVSAYQHRALLRGLDRVAQPKEEVLEWSA